MIVGLVKSLLVYYGIPFRRRRMRRMYRRFLSPGALAFDIGSHLGNRVRAFVSLGARAVAVEPTGACVRILTRLYGGRRDVEIEPVAVGAAEGTAMLHVARSAPTLNTISAEWISRVKEVSIFDGVQWSASETVPVTTLDTLIRRYGEPAFVKIDVEGHEPEVLQGLTTPVAALSFELLPASSERAVRCVERLEALGSYRYNYSPVETMRLRWSQWVSAATIRVFAESLPRDGRSGDVYAVRTDRLPSDNTL